MRAALALVTAVVLIVLVWPAGASGPPPEPRVYPPPGVTAIGTGHAAVERPPAGRRGERSIRRAVAVATRAAAPRAFAAARLKAQALAAAAGMRLGSVHAVAQETSGSFGWTPDAGTYGPGRYCGRRRVRDSYGGWRMSYRCQTPREVTLSVAVTFAPAG
jgi:hypothetical protein